MTPGVPLTSLEPIDVGGIGVPHPERQETKPKADSGRIPRTDRIPIFFPKTLYSTLVICGLWGGPLELLKFGSTKVYFESIGSKGVGSLSSKSLQPLGFQDGVGCWEGEKPPLSEPLTSA